jgi:hypothetical protein
MDKANEPGIGQSNQAEGVKHMITSSGKVWGALLFLMATCYEPIYAQVVSPELETALTAVETDSDGSNAALTARLLQAGVAGEPLLISAVTAGPPSSEIISLQADAQNQFANIQNWLATNSPGVTVDAGTLAAAQALTQSQYVMGVVQSYVNDYRENALEHLAYVAGSAGKALLSQIAADPTSPLQAASQNALQLGFASFKAELSNLDGANSRFELEGKFKLHRAASIDPVNQDVFLRLGTFVTMIPSGSFVYVANGHYRYVGQLTGFGGETVTGIIDFKLNEGGSYTLKAEGSGLDTSDFARPVGVGVIVGNIGGSTVTE